MEEKLRPKTGGRKPGSKNRDTKDLRVWITGFLQKNAKQVQKDWKLLKPAERISMMEKFLKYSLPTLQAINLTEDIDKELDLMTDEQLEELTNKILDRWKD